MTSERSNVIRLRQRGGRGWHETTGAIYKAVMAGTEFSAGMMRARKNMPFLADVMTGELPEEWVKVLRQDQPDYVVFSYDTPIAWHVPNDADQGDAERWVVPDEKYSPTTTRHQRLVLTALVFNKTEPIERLEDA